jgi:hypothetical protein
VRISQALTDPSRPEDRSVSAETFAREFAEIIELVPFECPGKDKTFASEDFSRRVMEFEGADADEA